MSRRQIHRESENLLFFWQPDPKEDDDMNKIDHRGGTGYPDPGYDKKNPGTGGKEWEDAIGVWMVGFVLGCWLCHFYFPDEEISNEIPVIGKAVMGPKESRTDSESLWHQPGILAGKRNNFAVRLWVRKLVGFYKLIIPCSYFRLVSHSCLLALEIHVFLPSRP